MRKLDRQNRGDDLSGGMNRKLFIQLAAAITMLVIAVQAVWALSVPGFRGPDEPHHVNSILRLESGGGWPAPGDAMLDASIVNAGRESGIIVPHAEDFVGLARTRLENTRIDPPTSPPYATYFRNADVTPHVDRSTIELGVASNEIDQMSQHPPVYYAGGALLVRVLDLDDQPWDRMLLVLRLYGIFLTIPLVPSLIYTARRLGATRPWSVTAGFIPFAVPQFFAITGGVSNDTLAVGLGALAVAALVKAGTEPITPKTVALVGGAVGVALWSKGQLLSFGLALILVFMLARRETWRTRITATLAAGIMALAIGWWWVYNIIRYGVIQPSGFVRTVPDHWDTAMAEFFPFLISATRAIRTSFFSAFGWLEADFHPALVTLLTTLLIGMIAWAVVAAGKNRRVILAVLSPAAGVFLLLLAESWITYQEVGMIAGVQGRYFFPFLAILAAMVLPLARFRGKTIVLFASACLAIGAYGFIFFLRSAYPGYPWIDFERYSLVTGVGQGPLITVIAFLTIIFIAAFVLSAIIGIHETRRTESSELEETEREDEFATEKAAREEELADEESTEPQNPERTEA